ncbi:MAG TPA: putative metal-binding motif-containing protein, partial [Myxococcales bacterium]|nr:putative metal-binding motif-containing protein [Myxococcales bacterium]
ITDHPPLPCESFEYSVYLTDNLEATDVVPLGQQVDRTKWNEAQLYKAFSEGWDPNATADGITTVWQLPCGITFRYASMVAGNHGNPTSVCEYDSNEDELDAVAGLNQDDTAICPDNDGDGYAAESCGGTDCNDNDPSVHPGAPENCSSPMDMDCDGKLPTCPSGTVCVEGYCGPPCGGGEFGGNCQSGFTCLDGGCLPTGCLGGCDGGLVCNGKACVDPCAGAVCPAGQVCRGGGCVDPCDAVVCPAGQACAGGACQPSCACTGCGAGQVCLDAGSCLAEACLAVTCPTGENCTDAGGCESACAGVVCPVGQYCDAGSCGADPCFGVDCQVGEVCLGGSCVTPVPDGGPAHDAGPTADAGGTLPADGGARPAGPDAGSGQQALAKSSCCGCSQTGLEGPLALWLALAAFAARRRRP